MGRCDDRGGGLLPSEAPLRVLAAGGNLTLFRAPARKDEFEKWARAIPRADKPLQENSAVCERHLDPRGCAHFLLCFCRFIMRHYVHVVDGKEVDIPRDVPALRESAIPTIFANLPKYMTRTLPKEEEENRTVLFHACKEEPRRH
ncbi:uncharacterized protein LOC125756593 [Rhipicephalus sanguineus]|uniref:uncharacterized protein LOC125756593 n=1 Tax=Rhipicephalus sanguineus TaxID=34632 RepID=UPI0020C33568|nr:uncharacterized protein LOC125756593 [Rhipicephalus sanguineus]